MAGRPVVIRVTHEFIEDPAATDRGYTVWAAYLADGLAVIESQKQRVEGQPKAIARRRRGSA